MSLKTKKQQKIEEEEAEEAEMEDDWEYMEDEDGDN